MMPYLGEKRCGGKPVVDPENKVPVVACRPVDEASRATPDIKTVQPCHFLFALLLIWGPRSWR